MDNRYFADLFAYDAWATAQVMDRLEAAVLPPEVDGRVLDLLSHVLRAQDVWLGRIQGTEAATHPFWQRDTLARCRRRAADANAAWLAFLADADLRGACRYRNSKGTPYTTPLTQIVTHLINHGTHHRAQIALLLRQSGVAPPLTDYIYYTRRHEEPPPG